MDWKLYFPKAILNRGRSYYQQHRVTDFENKGNHCTALVEGTDSYRVHIWSPGTERMRMQCTCMHAAEGNRCKHMAAVLFQWQAMEDRQRREREKVRNPLPPAQPGRKPFFHMAEIISDYFVLKSSLKEAEKFVGQNRIQLARFRLSYDRYSHGPKAAVEGYYHSNGRSFELSLDFGRKKIEKYYCPVCGKQHYNHAYYSRYWTEKHELCSHMMALLILTDRYTKQYDPGDHTDYDAVRFLQSFDREQMKTAATDKAEEYGTVSLEPRIAEGITGHELSFRIGNGGKMYVVKNLTELHDTVNEGKELALGKSASIDFATESFDEESRVFYSLIEKEVKRARAIEKKMDRKATYTYSGTLETGKTMPLTGEAIDTVYEVMKGKSIDYNALEASGKQPLILDDSEPVIDLRIEIETEEDGERLDAVLVSGEAPALIDGVRHQYFISDGHLGILSEQMRAHIKPFEDAASSYDREFCFSIGRKKAAEFYYGVLPQLRDDPVFNILEEGSIDGLIPAEARFEFFLDAENEKLLCEAYVLYEDDRFRMSSLVHMGKDGIVFDPIRDLSQETRVIQILEGMFPVYDDQMACFECGDTPDNRYELLKKGVDRLRLYGEVHSTDALSASRIRRGSVVQLGVSLESGLLDLEILTKDMDPADLADLIDGYRRKKKYHRLSNGDFVELEDNESLETLMNLIDDLGVPVQDFVKGRIEVPAYRALYLEKMLEEHEDLVAGRDRTFRNLVKNFKTISDSDHEVPASLRQILRPYQSFGFKWLSTLSLAGFGGILADEMGLGKTLQVITMILAEKEAQASEGETARPAGALVVCPASLVYNWAEEIARFAPGLKALVVSGTRGQRRKLLKSSESFDFLITSYDLLKRDIDVYGEKQFEWQIIDEAQYIKNARSAAAKSVKLVHAAHRVALTGTPIENRLSELWSIFDFLMPGFLYGYESFRRRFELPISKGGDPRATEELKNMISPFVLRRKKTDVLKDLPDKLEEVHYAGFEEEQRKLYDSQVMRISNLIDSEEANIDKSKIEILAELTKIRQICCDPGLLFEDYKGGSAKREACLELIQSAIDGGHKMLLFSQFTSMLAILEQDLQKEGIQYYTITGSTPKEERIKRVKAFNSDAVPVFLISLKAGGTGLNLTGADVVIHYDPWWNQAAQDQATDRTHRIGQTKNVTVFKLIAKDTIEEKILRLQESKKELSDSVLSGETRSLGSMTKDELKELLGV